MKRICRSSSGVRALSLTACTRSLSISLVMRRKDHSWSAGADEYKNGELIKKSNKNEPITISKMSNAFTDGLLW